MSGDGVHDGQQLTAKTQPALPGSGSVIDLTDPVNTDTYLKITSQSQLRDRLSNTRSAVLECSDNFDGILGSCQIPPRNSKDHVFSTRVGDHMPAWPTHVESQVASDVVEKMFAGNPNTTLNGWKLQRDIWAGLYLNKDTAGAPMRQDSQLYSETVTQPFEKQLVSRLMHGTDKITNADLMQQSLQVCGNDRELAILTLANFSKNMAAIERRQIFPELISPTLKGVYTEPIIDSIFQRMEGLADTPSQRYNKEGAIYHFYGAMYAASQVGDAALPMAALENIMFGHDRIEDAAAYLGTAVGEASSLDH